MLLGRSRFVTMVLPGSGHSAMKWALPRRSLARIASGLGKSCAARGTANTSAAKIILMVGSEGLAQQGARVQRREAATRQTVRLAFLLRCRARRERNLR